MIFFFFQCTEASYQGKMTSIHMTLPLMKSQPPVQMMNLYRDQEWNCAGYVAALDTKHAPAATQSHTAAKNIKSWTGNSGTRKNAVVLVSVARWSHPMNSSLVSNPYKTIHYK